MFVANKIYSFLNPITIKQEFHNNTCHIFLWPPNHHVFFWNQANCCY
ncbi:MAG: hypothetical protein AVDCRST_MAG96-2736 [uncultured Segetibacter sp.]|uniref:Uncharacterized protein n=1 Tax=uncultured Segetibacter sp. TaxID=481133 RepID=A0A6J4T9U3_9BACT|nr:MAG: hypothetical protein AVDCRST_MAG96-2736 [uncultured Segetibacter sp.]